MGDRADIEHAVNAGAAALVKGGVVCDPVTGDVLHDYDWTPMEAARVVLEAANYAGAVEALEKIGGGNSERIRMSAEMAYRVARSALDRLGGQS